MLPSRDSRWLARRSSCSWLICHLNNVGSLMFYRLQKAVTSTNCESRRTRRQIKVLQALDLAKTQWYHFTAVVITGMGFFTDAYDLFCISLVTDLLGWIYYHDTVSGNKPGSLPRSVAAAVKGIALCGTTFGQLFFGTLGDNMGRKRVYGVTLILMVVCSVASGLSFHHTRRTVITLLCFFRFLLGFSISGDYPLSAAIMSEYANKRTRGAFMAAVFAMQGLGNLAAGIVVLMVSSGFMKTRADKTEMLDQADYVRRIVLMFGAIPALLTFYWRMRMPETARYTVLVARNLIKQAVSDMNIILDIEINDLTEEEDANILAKQDNFGLLSSMFLCRHGWHLLSSTYCWFMLDVVFYSLNLFMIEIFTTGTNLFVDASKEGILEQTQNIAKTQAIIAVSGTLPGYFFTVMFIDRIGRIRIQLMGFSMITIFILGLAAMHDVWKNTESLPVGFAVMYGFIFFFANFGPNSTTFIVPTEIFPTRLRSTCHGMSGAGGKAGAIVGVFLFLYAGWRIPRKLLVLASCNLVGIIFTLFLPESKGMSLEEIAGDIQEDVECESEQ
ncbi:hypothetical protein C2845_PM15G02030 [Panicum miliaceum]|uniref:H(+)/Pi cotransporter n=1 Tax=Panicum miliaceum TaxID=4540 RepID=A0A3L6Q9W0_PANMI|nr:hypothetical protein C2845_PM15G02030 [Panicum miliaceum]